MYCVLNSEHLVLDTFLFNATLEVATTDYIDRYDQMYPNQVERIVDATTSKSVTGLLPEKNWWWDDAVDKFYPSKKPSISHVWDLNFYDWVLPE